MEITCSRCHQPVLADNCYCSVCGLPQLVYAAEGAASQAASDRWEETARDANAIAWKPALRTAMKLAIPVGVLCSVLSPFGVFGLFWMSAAATWAVALYLRGQRTAWITIGAGARIGLVTGLLGGWTAAATTAATLYALRFFFHHGILFDDFWQNQVSEKVSQQWASSGVDAHTIAVAKALLNSPEGRGGMTICVMGCLVLALVVFAVAGGALGARMMGRRRQPEV
jgi:hypothetical protein